VGLLANLKLRAESDDVGDKAQHARDLGEFLLKLKVDLATAPANASDQELAQKFANLKAPMMSLSKCPDFVVNRGHYFGTDRFKEEPPLTDDDKWALIEFVKTF